MRAKRAQEGSAQDQRLGAGVEGGGRTCPTELTLLVQLDGGGTWSCHSSLRDPSLASPDTLQHPWSLRRPPRPELLRAAASAAQGFQGADKLGIKQQALCKLWRGELGLTERPRSVC